jgi:hypothetical protein
MWGWYKIFILGLTFNLKQEIQIQNQIQTFNLHFKFSMFMKDVLNCKLFSLSTLLQVTHFCSILSLCVKRFAGIKTHYRVGEKDCSLKKLIFASVP